MNTIYLKGRFYGRSQHVKPMIADKDINPRNLLGSSLDVAHALEDPLELDLPQEKIDKLNEAYAAKFGNRNYDAIVNNDELEKQAEKSAEELLDTINKAQEKLLKGMNRYYKRKFFREAYKESKKVTNYTKPKKKRKKKR